MDIEKHEFNVFMCMWETGGYPHQRLGQAFYNHFNLHRLSDQDALKNLYEKDGSNALHLIKEIFNFN